MNDNLLLQEELDMLREQVNAPSYTTSEMDDLNAIVLLATTRQKIEKVFDDLADSLQARLTLLNEATKPPPKKRKVMSPKMRKWCSATLSAGQRLLLPTLCIGIFCAGIIASVLFSTRTNDPVRPQVDVIRPITETLEEFAIRESESLTADERRKLITVTEKILTDHFTAPSAMREAFRYERLKAGIDSPAFNAFSEKWAVKAEETATESVEAIRSVYESLLRGLKVQAYSDVCEESEVRSEEFEENSGQNLSNLPDSLSMQRQRIFRRR